MSMAMTGVCSAASATCCAAAFAPCIASAYAIAPLIRRFVRFFMVGSFRLNFEQEVTEEMELLLNLCFLTGVNRGNRVSFPSPLSLFPPVKSSGSFVLEGKDALPIVLHADNGPAILLCLLVK